MRKITSAGNPSSDLLDAPGDVEIARIYITVPHYN